MGVWVCPVALSTDLSRSRRRSSCEWPMRYGVMWHHDIEARPNGSLVNGFLRWHQGGIKNSLENDNPLTLFNYHDCNFCNRWNHCKYCSRPILTRDPFGHAWDVMRYVWDMWVSCDVPQIQHLETDHIISPTYKINMSLWCIICVYVRTYGYDACMYVCKSMTSYNGDANGLKNPEAQQQQVDMKLGLWACEYTKCVSNVYAACLCHHTYICRGVHQYARYVNVITASGYASGMVRVCIGYESGMNQVCIGVCIKWSPFLSN